MADLHSDCSSSTACGTGWGGAMAPGRPDLRWSAKVRASAAFCLVGIIAGTGLYFSNLAYVTNRDKAAAAAAERQTYSGGFISFGNLSAAIPAVDVYLY